MSNYVIAGSFACYGLTRRKEEEEQIVLLYRGIDLVNVDAVPDRQRY